MSFPFLASAGGISNYFSSFKNDGHPIKNGQGDLDGIWDCCFFQSYTASFNIPLQHQTDITEDVNMGLQFYCGCKCLQEIGILNCPINTKETPEAVNMGTASPPLYSATCPLGLHIKGHISISMHKLVSQIRRPCKNAYVCVCMSMYVQVHTHKI